MRLFTLLAPVCLALTCVMAAAAVEAQSAATPAGVSQAQRAAPGFDRGSEAAVLSNIAIGFVLATVGAASIITAAAYWKAGGATLLSFGLFTFLSGLSILSAGPLVQMLSLPRLSLQFSSEIIVYLLPVPGLFYAERIRGRGWLSSLH
jgi:hypothetical protein